MLVFGAFVPHSPLLVPAIGKEPNEALAKLRSGLHEVSEALYATKPDTVVFLSTHSTQFPNAFSIQLHDPYRIDLSSFGDLSPSRGYRCDIGLIDRIQRAARKNGIPLSLNTDEALDYGAGVPMKLLLEPFSKLKTVAITWSGLSSKEHVTFGRLLRDVIEDAHERVAIVATGDLSHALSHDSPEGFHEEGPHFDTTVCEALQQISLSRLMSLEGEVALRAAQSAFPSLLLLFGALDRTDVSPNFIAYETPFGVGMVIAMFQLPALLEPTEL